MCGIAGFIHNTHPYSKNEIKNIVTVMTNTLRHRGPDDGDVWIDATSGVALGHRRLSILDLSPSGHQPMMSETGRYVIVFNGEIYNYIQIRSELEESNFNSQFTWRGHSDTEVLLAAIEAWGLESAIKRCIGMFAIVIWDRQERCLYLVRDRIGEKPLYYGWMGDTFLFGSELKALRAHPTWRGEINRDAVTLFLRHSCIPAPYSIFLNIYKLLPGTILTIPAKNERAASRKEAPFPKPYWSARDKAESGVADPFIGTDAEAIKQLDSLLRDVVKKQMVADVPLGAFLSGGVDSSTIVALMQAQSIRPVKSFTIGFYEEKYNESKYAKAVAKYLGTEHTEMYVRPEHAFEVIPYLPLLYDEPFSDPSQIPTFLVSQLTRKHVTVSLSGDAGDELFGGYNRYFLGRSIWKSIGWIPKMTRRGLATFLTSISPQSWIALLTIFDPLLPQKMRQKSHLDNIMKLAEILNSDDPIDMYPRLVSHWKDPKSLVIGSTEPPTILTERGQWADLTDFTQMMMYLDLVTYLPDDILAKVDRAAMGVSLETRVPFLDHRVVEFAWRLPLSMKVRNGKGKWLLRHVLYQYVPKEIIERPKSGFAVPLDSWLRGPLRDWAAELLNEKRLSEKGYFNSAAICDKWQEHLSGKRNWQYHLWDILMFQAWLEQNEYNSI